MSNCSRIRTHWNEVFFDSLAVLWVEPALGVVDAGVLAEEGLIAVNDPGVYADDCLEDCYGIYLCKGR